MLNPPLAHLSDDLLAHIVEHVADLPLPAKNLKNLSLTDRAFTQSCQVYIFRTLLLDGSNGNEGEMSRKLEKMKNILNHKPTFANLVRIVEFNVSPKKKISLWPEFNVSSIQNPWHFNHRTFIDILQLVAKSPMPPHELHFGGRRYFPPEIQVDDPLLVVERLTQSFFSHSLTILHLTMFKNVPITFFLICPSLREVLLDHVEVFKDSDQYPDTQYSGRESPALELFSYRDSQSVVKQMITPPPCFHAPVVLWSKLRVLTLSPHEKNEMVCLQPILDAGCETLEELYLTHLQVDDSEQLPLAGLVNLSQLSRLRVFALYAIIKCAAPRSAVPPDINIVSDINIVLGTIPASGNVTNLSFDFTIFGKHPFRGCPEQDWVGICNEAIRISAGKPVELDFETAISTRGLETRHHGEDRLYANIREKTALLSDYPNICTHFWNPTCWANGLGPMPRGQVRGRCRR